MHPEAYVQMAREESDHWWFRIRRRIIERALIRLELPKNARILEVGSGTGGNLGMLMAYGRVDAVEMDALACAHAHRRYDGSVSIYHGEFPAACPPDQGYDLICFFDVLEHIDDDTAALNAASERLNAGGRILVTVPAYAWMWSAHDEFLHHQRRYTLSQLRSLGQCLGLKESDATYFNTLLLPVMLALRWVDRFLGRKTSSGAGIPAPWLNFCLGAIFSMEIPWLRSFSLPCGASIMMLFRKNS